ncbi:MAG: hypothetical protein EOO38_24220, partial [Cytophagaceae bacterium]
MARHTPQQAEHIAQRKAVAPNYSAVNWSAFLRYAFIATTSAPTCHLMKRLTQLLFVRKRISQRPPILDFVLYMPLHFPSKAALSVLLLSPSVIAPALGPRAEAQERSIKKPKLAIILVMDQVRAEYLTRYAPLFGEGGFKSLMRTGATLTNAHYG